MADVRVAPNVVLSDGTTLSQLAAVDSSGRLSVSLTASSATVTVDSELPAAAALADAAANPTTPTVGAANLVFNGTTWDRLKESVAALDSTGTGIPTAGIVGQLDDTSTSTVTENQFAHVRISTRRALLIEGVASGTVVPVSLTSTTITGTVTVDSELPAAAALADATANPTSPIVGSAGLVFNGTTWDRARGAATLADALANPGTGLAQGQNFLMGFNGTTWDRVRTANTGRLQVDVITGGGSDTPTNPINNYQTNASLAAGSTSNHDTADFGAATKKVNEVIMGASVPMKGELQYVDNSVGTTLAVFFTPAGVTQVFRPAHRNYWAHTFSATAGLDGFRLIRTNLDASEAADVYSVIEYED